jgi:uncharacterized OB-fold protein
MGIIFTLKMETIKNRRIRQDISTIPKGRIYSFEITTDPNQLPPQFRKNVPAVLGIIEAESGERVTAHITDVDIVSTPLVVNGIIQKDEFGIEIPRIKGLVDATGKEVRIGSKVQLVIRRIGEDGERGTIIYNNAYSPEL